MDGLKYLFLEDRDQACSSMRSSLSLTNTHTSGFGKKLGLGIKKTETLLPLHIPALQKWVKMSPDVFAWHLKLTRTPLSEFFLSKFFKIFCQKNFFRTLTLLSLNCLVLCSLSLFLSHLTKKWLSWITKWAYLTDPNQSLPSWVAQLEDLLECPVCLKTFMDPPIFQVWSRFFIQAFTTGDGVLGPWKTT